MNRKELISRTANALRDLGLRKKVPLPKRNFYISDDDGAMKTFSIKAEKKEVLYNSADVENILNIVIEVIKDALQEGDEVTWPGFGSIGLKFRKARATKNFNTQEWVDVPARYVPKFKFGKDLRNVAALYEQMLNDRNLNAPLPVFDEDDEEED